jgi:hypothetical protein
MVHCATIAATDLKKSLRRESVSPASITGLNDLEEKLNQAALKSRFIICQRHDGGPQTL